jgi:hypothetical protein
MKTPRSFLAAGLATVALLIPSTATGATKGLDKEGIGKAITAACDVANKRTNVRKAKYKGLLTTTSGKGFAKASSDAKAELDALAKSLRAIKVTGDVDGGTIKKFISVLSIRSKYQDKLTKALRTAKDAKDAKAITGSFAEERLGIDQRFLEVGNDMGGYGFSCSFVSTFNFV